jgi:hypothetical protein
MFMTAGPSFIETARLNCASQATNGTKAAQMASKPSAIPVAVKYARIASSPSRLGQNGTRAAMKL